VRPFILIRLKKPLLTSWQSFLGKVSG
jgi:hypothetical protein